MNTKNNRENLLKETLNLIEEFGVTAYEIEKNISISAVGVQKIIDGTTKKPQQRTLLSIISYINSKYNKNNSSQDLHNYSEKIDKTIPKTTLDKFDNITDDELSLYILRYKKRIMENEVIKFYIEKKASEIAREVIAKEIKLILGKQ